MEFKKWTDDSLTEADWKDWFRGVGDKFKGVGRMLGYGSPANQQTIGTYPGKYVDASGKAIPNAPDSALQPKAQPMRKAARALGYAAPQQRQAATQQQAPQRVKFTAEDLLQVKAAISDYQGLVKKFYHKLNSELSKINPRAEQYAKSVFNQQVLPHYERLKSWIKWVDDMISWLPKRESVEDEFLMEAIKVSHRDFEQMAASIKALTQSMGRWVDGLGQQLGPRFMNWAKKLFIDTLTKRQYHLDAQFNTLAGKLKELMQAHGRNYQNPKANQARYAPPAYPYGLSPGFRS